MKDRSDRTPPRRSYPPFWEKAVPIMEAGVVMVIVILLSIAIAVVLEVFPGAA